MAKKEHHHPKHHTTTPRQQVWVLGFLGGAVVLLGAVLFLANGRSRIAFTWTPQPIESKTTLTAAAAPSESEIATSFVQTSVDVERTFTAEPTTSTPTPAPTAPVFTGKASGKATITNRYTKAQPLQAGTRLQSADGHIFRTQARVDVPVGGSVTTLVIADVAGEQGAKTKGATFILPGLWAGLQDKITGVAAEDFVGETSAAAPATTLAGLTANELANAQQELIKEAIEKATPALQKLVPGGRVLYPGMVGTAVTKHSGPAIADKVSSYTLQLTVQATGVALAPESLVKAATALLENALSTDLQLVNVATKNFDFAVSNVDTKKQRADVALTARASTVPTPTHPLLQHATYSGKKPYAVRALLAKEKAVTNVMVELSPFWTRTIPSNKDDLQLEITRAE
ncbi:MAG: hypothetical protein AAB515_04215 [Patescibacteria group bacterium]